MVWKWEDKLLCPTSSCATRFNLASGTCYKQERLRQSHFRILQIHLCSRRTSKRTFSSARNRSLASLFLLSLLNSITIDTMNVKAPKNSTIIQNENIPSDWETAVQVAFIVPSRWHDTCLPMSGPLEKSQRKELSSCRVQRRTSKSGQAKGEFLLCAILSV